MKNEYNNKHLPVDFPFETTFVLLDNRLDYNDKSKVVASWTNFDVQHNQESIPLWVEKMSTRIKKEYLAWVYDLGKSEIEDTGISLEAYLEEFGGKSFWWMSSTALRSPYLTDSIYSVFKLRALEILYREKECQGVLYLGSDKKLNQVLKIWCEELGHPYWNVKSPESQIRQSCSLGGVLIKLPYWMQTLIYLGKQWFLRFRYVRSINRRNSNIENDKNQITIVTFFPNIDAKKTQEGDFWSHYWKDFHSFLDNYPAKVNWVWFCFDSKDVSFKEAISLQKICNTKDPDKYSYFILEEFLTFKNLIKAIKSYIQIYIRIAGIKGVESKFSFADSKLNYFPFLEHEWKSSLLGKKSLENLLLIGMFDHMAKHIPAQPWGIYTWEGQPWESALISAWRRQQKNTRIIACQHFSFIRSMHLNLFLDPRVYFEADPENLPAPDKFGINSSGGIKIMEESGVPQDKIAKIEALRSFNLIGNYESEKKELKSTDRTLLVVTGVVASEARFQIQLLQDSAAMNGLKNYSQVLFKAHPGLPVESILKTIKISFSYEIVDKELKNLWTDVDVVYCSNTTGVSLEAAWLGTPVIIIVANNSFNLNPFFGSEGAKFISNKEMLCHALDYPARIKISDDDLFLDRDLKAWKELLDSADLKTVSES